MSFMSGIMMGAAIGRNIHDMITMNKGRKNDNFSKRGRIAPKKQTRAVADFSLESMISGRRRYRLSGLVNNASLAVLLEKQLSRIKYIYDVKANPLTGSLLITYSREHETDMEQLEKKLRERAVPPTLYAKSWQSTGSFLNTQVRRVTGGWFDISTLVSMIFLIRGLRKILIYGDRPNGTSMIWWALHLMKGWKS